MRAGASSEHGGAEKHEVRCLGGAAGEAWVELILIPSENLRCNFTSQVKLAYRSAEGAADGVGDSHGNESAYEHAPHGSCLVGATKFRTVEASGKQPKHHGNERNGNTRCVRRQHRRQQRH